MWAYVEERRRQLVQDQWLSQAETARRIHVRATTVTDWYRHTPGFVKWFAERLDVDRDALKRAAEAAIYRKTCNGNLGFAKLALELLLADAQGGELPAGSLPNGSGPQVTAGVVFMNVPLPPTPEQALALQPPVGSNTIIPAPPLIPLPERAPSGGQS